jgi:hypothetical protein
MTKKTKKKTTRGSHFLPKGAYLRRFKCPGPQDQIIRYQRDKAPFSLSLEKAAKERDLYNFTNQAGELDDSLEDVLQKIEDLALPIIGKLCAATSAIEIDWGDKEKLALFIAFQHVRTPAFRQSQRANMSEMSKKVMQFVASDPALFEARARNAIEDGRVGPDFDIEEARQFLEGGEYKIDTVEDHDYFLGTSLSIGPEFAQILMFKKMLLLAGGDQTPLLTSDHPVIVLPFDVRGNRNHVGGFLYSDIGLPISPKRYLIFWNDENPVEPPDRSDYHKETVFFNSVKY